MTTKISPSDYAAALELALEVLPAGYAWVSESSADVAHLDDPDTSPRTKIRLRLAMAARTQRLRRAMLRPETEPLSPYLETT